MVVGYKGKLGIGNKGLSARPCWLQSTVMRGEKNNKLYS
jgi:hypothetical protein